MKSNQSFRVLINNINIFSSLTEERISIRESLRIYLTISQYLHDKKRNIKLSTFESICSNAKAKLMKDDKILKETQVHSCGNTMNCFLSLFLSKKQVQQDEISHIIDGNAFYQLYSNPNMIIYSFTAHYVQPWLQYMNIKVSLKNKIVFYHTVFVIVSSRP